MKRKRPSVDAQSSSPWMRIATSASFLLPMALAFLLVWPTLAGGFLADDYLMNIYLDRAATEVVVDWSSVWRDFSGPWLGLEGAAIYRPLISLQYGIEIALGGGDPYYLHAGNVLAHLLSVALVCWLCHALCSRAPRRCALVAGTLFALHPASVETVAWISGRVTGTQVLFSLATLAFFAWARRRSRVEFLAPAWICAALALGSKESALMLPALLLLVDGLIRMPTSWTGVIGRHAFFLPLWLGYLAARKGFLGTFLGEGLAGWEPTGLVATPNEILAGLAVKATALLAPFGDLFVTFRGLLLPSPNAFFARITRPQELLPFLEALALLGLLTLLVALVIRGVRDWRFAWTAFLGVLGVFATFAPTYGFPLGEGLAGMRHLYEGAAWLAIVLSLLAFEVRPLSVVSGTSVQRATAVLAIVSLIAWGVGLGLRTWEGIESYERAWQEVALVEEKFQEEGANATVERPLVAVSTPSQWEGVPMIRSNAVYALGERPFSPRDLPVVGLNCTLESTLHSEPLHLDAAPLRAMMEFGGKLLFWNPGGRAFLTIDTVPDELPDRLSVSGTKRVVFARIPSVSVERVSPLEIERVEVLVRGAPSGGRLSWFVEEGRGNEPFVVFGEGETFEEEGELRTRFSIDLSHSIAFFVAHAQGGLRGFEIAFDDEVPARDVLSVVFSERVELLPMGKPLRGNGLHVGEESVLLHPPPGELPPGRRRSLVLMAPHAALLVPLEGRRVRFDETVARDLRRIALLMRSPRVYFYFLEEPSSGQALPARRSPVDWFTLLSHVPGQKDVTN